MIFDQRAQELQAHKLAARTSTVLMSAKKPKIGGQAGCWDEHPVISDKQEDDEQEVKKIVFFSLLLI
jgi:hypothetical protein